MKSFEVSIAAFCTLEVQAEDETQAQLHAENLILAGDLSPWNLLGATIGNVSEFEGEDSDE